MKRISKAFKVTYQFMLLCPVTLAMGTYMLLARKGLFEQFL